MENIYLEYKGYTANLTRHFEHGINRLYGKPCVPGSQTPLGEWGFAGDNLEEAKQLFKHQVDKIIEYENYKNRQAAWEKDNDYLSIASVLNILPDIFEKRILKGSYDIGLNDKVVGGDYEVPLFYVTLAWDILLKGSLGCQSFRIGPEEDDDFSEETLQEFIVETGAIRTRGKAIEENDKMKLLWKKYFNIDIDVLDVDFLSFDRHLPPNVCEDSYYRYFQDVPDGVDEWILSPINYPSDKWTPYEAVSCLMEYVNEVLSFENH